jgi:hypothetical protein
MPEVTFHISIMFLHFYRLYCNVTFTKMAIKLDPKEVKAHLYRLGYCDITGEQLKEFIKGKVTNG